MNQKTVKSFGQIKNDIKLVCEKYPPGLLFLDNFASPIILKGDITISRKGFKMLTYDVVSENVNTPPIIPTFNIAVSPDILGKKIIMVLKKYSHKKDLSDCGVIVNDDYSKCRAFLQDLSDDNYSPVVLSVYDGDGTKIKEWINREKKSLKCVVFFSYFSNKVLLEDEFKIPGLKYVEVFTSYGRIVPQVEYSVNINWSKCLVYALGSKKFKIFLKKNKFKKKYKNFVNFIVNYDTIIEVRRNLFPIRVEDKEHRDKGR